MKRLLRACIVLGAAGVALFLYGWSTIECPDCAGEGGLFPAPCETCGEGVRRADLP